MSTLVEFSMSPLDKGESVSAYVARSLDIIDRCGLPYQLHAMGTILEGDLSACLRVIEQCYARMSADCARVTCTIKIDARQGHENRLKTKIDSVQASLGRALRT